MRALVVMAVKCSKQSKGNGDSTNEGLLYIDSSLQSHLCQLAQSLFRLVMWACRQLACALLCFTTCEARVTGDWSAFFRISFYPADEYPRSQRLPYLDQETALTSRFLFDDAILYENYINCDFKMTWNGHILWLYGLSRTDGYCALREIQSRWNFHSSMSWLWPLARVKNSYQAIRVKYRWTEVSPFNLSTERNS